MEKINKKIKKKPDCKCWHTDACECGNITDNGCVHTQTGLGAATTAGCRLGHWVTGGGLCAWRVFTCTQQVGGRRRRRREGEPG